MDNLNKKYFEDNKASFIKRFKDKYVVIGDCKLIGAYATDQEAYEEACSKFNLGEFYIAKCVKSISDSSNDKKAESKSASGGMFWICCIVAFVLHILSGVFNAYGDIEGAEGSFALAMFFYILSGICFWVWLIGKVNKVSDKSSKTQQEITELKKQIEELKNKKDQ